MTETITRGTLWIAAACCVLAGCARDERPRARSTVAVDSLPGDSVFIHSDERVNLPSSRIYYTLTNHEWYARGEPLVHDGRSYEPAGMPISVSLSEMNRIGDFQGVEYYARDGDSEPVVYVPVFDGYWQQFRADPSAVAAPPEAADASAGDVAADSLPDPD